MTHPVTPDTVLYRESWVEVRARPAYSGNGAVLFSIWYVTGTPETHLEARRDASGDRWTVPYSREWHPRMANPAVPPWWKRDHPFQTRKAWLRAHLPVTLTDMAQRVIEDAQRVAQTVRDKAAGLESSQARIRGLIDLRDAMEVVNQLAPSTAEGD